MFRSQPFLFDFNPVTNLKKYYPSDVATAALVKKHGDAGEALKMLDESRISGRIFSSRPDLIAVELSAQDQTISAL